MATSARARMLLAHAPARASLIMATSRTTFGTSPLVLLSLCVGLVTSLGSGIYRADALKISEDEAWSGLPGLGQVSGVSVDGDGNLHVFHRAERVWDEEAFENFNFKRPEDGPIRNDTVLVIDPKSGRILYQWGSDKFYMPHGLTVDDKGNTWVTDVALHQVFKFPARESKSTLVLGEALVPGTGRGHFCQPTDVAVAKPGYFFVSDGYCNSRIVMFSQWGAYMKEFGAEDGMVVPHSLALIPEHGAVCVADRENWRILCYSSGLDGNMPGMPLAQVKGEGLSRVYAIARRGDQLLAVNGPDWNGRARPSASSLRGSVIDIESGTPTELWGPEQGFAHPHDVAVSPDGKYVYVSEIDLEAPKKVHKFSVKG